MRVIVPFVHRHPEVESALEGHDPEWRFVGDSDRAYFDLLSELWADGESFIIVEHDNIVTPASIPELEACEHDWCGFPHPYANQLHYGLGCVKFSAPLIARNPLAMVKVGVMSDARHPKRHWCRLDSWLQYLILPQAGEEQHRHETPIAHLGGPSRGSSHGC